MDILQPWGLGVGSPYSRLYLRIFFAGEPAEERNKEMCAECVTRIEINFAL